MTAYDWLLVRRTAALGLMLGTLVFLLMVATDDPSGSLPGRLGRLAALAPLAGGGAAFMATAQSRVRGEVRAFAATGVPPIQACWGAVVGGISIGTAGSALAVVPGVDLAPLFPRALPTGAGWMRQGDAWIDATRGIAVRADGELSRVAAAGPSSFLPDHPTPSIVLALILAALAVPLWATTRGAPLRRVLVAFGAAAAAVLGFHLVAADWLPPAALAFPPAVILVDAVALHWRGAWS